MDTAHETIPHVAEIEETTDGKSANALTVEKLRQDNAFTEAQAELIAKYAGSVADPEGMTETIRVLDSYRDEWVE